MPSRKSGSCSTRRKHSLGNLRRAHPASGATWNVQVVRGKMSSKCLWHACRALILGLTLMLLGAGMATIGYYADQLSVASEVRGNATVRVKNESKGFHLNNLSYVGPIVMGFGGFIVVASCVMTFEARDSAAKVVPARLKATNTSKTTVRSNQSSGASQRRAAGIQHQNTRWDHHLGVFRSSPAEPPTQPPPLDRQALTAALVHFSKSISSSARFSPKLRRLSHTGSVPNLSTLVPHPYANSTNISQLLSPNRKPLYLIQKRHRHHRHHHPLSSTNSNGRHVKTRGARISSSLVQRTTRESATSLLQPLPPAHRLYWHALSIDESGRISEAQANRIVDRTKRSDTAKRHVLSRQKPIEHEEEKRQAETSSPLGNRRSSTFSDSSYSGRWTYRCASIASRASSIDSRKIHVDMHSPEALPKSILRSPKRLSSGPSTTPSVEREFRSQLSVCSEPPAPMRQLSGQSSYEPCVPEEDGTDLDEKYTTPSTATTTTTELAMLPQNLINPISSDAPQPSAPEMKNTNGNVKKIRPDTLALNIDSANIDSAKRSFEINKLLHRSNSSRTYYRNRPKAQREYNDDAIFFTKSSEQQLENCSNDSYDSLRVINERRHKLLKTESETALIERKANFEYSGTQVISTATLSDELTDATAKTITKLDLADQSSLGTKPTADDLNASSASVVLVMEPSDLAEGTDANVSDESQLS